MSTEGITTGYYLFLVPPPEIENRLGASIEKTAQIYGGPVFSPHITLLPEIQTDVENLEKGARQLVHAAAPTLTFESIETGPEYFKCCYLTLLDTSALTHLHKEAQEYFKMSVPFAPHVSLAYGKYPEETLARMKEDARAELTPLLGRSFTFPGLAIWETKGRVQEWKHIKTFPFRS